ncbi:hypothetical protein ACS3UN_10845 [Oscillospiraceae bacterium LTW-04]|nr:hypothetical protein RBH76_12595 [Oscillospiraceae bacterium MB24-C1]
MVSFLGGDPLVNAGMSAAAFVDPVPFDQSFKPFDHLSVKATKESAPPCGNADSF